MACPSARKNQPLSVVVLFAATFGVLATLVMPVVAQSSAPATNRPLVAPVNVLHGPGFARRAKGGRSVTASPVNWNEKVLHTFGSGSDGWYPYSALISDAAGNLYGTTLSGGNPGYGTVFELSPGGHGGWTETVLYNFCAQSDCADGAYPYAGLTNDAAGNLYGATSVGGTGPCNISGYGPGCGTVFELSPDGQGGWTETVLYNFCSQNNCTDGFYPFASPTLDAGGNLYGTTLGGGNACNGYYFSSCGTVFKLSPTAGGGWSETVLHSFIDDGVDGFEPIAGLILDSAGNLYGTTLFGGNNGSNCNIDGNYGCGTVFEVSPVAGGGWTESVLYRFPNYDGTDGFYPWAGVIMDGAGNLYGATIEGGVYNQQYGGGGTAFELSPSGGGGGWAETKFYSFGNGMDSAGPFAGLILDASGNLYGTTANGGLSENGTVYELSPAGSGWTETVLYYFCSENGCLDGEGPVASLIFDAAGNLYGTTLDGGTHGVGTVFELTQQQVSVNIVNFDFAAVPVTCSSGYASQGVIASCTSDMPTQNFNQSPGFGWFMAGAGAVTPPIATAPQNGVGLSGAGTNLQPPPFTGLPFAQAAFLQDNGYFVRQPVTFAAGNYTLSSYLGSRYENSPGDGNQTVQALIDGNVVGTWMLSSFTPFTLQTVPFTVSYGGVHTLEFRGVNPGDHTAFLSYVSITTTDRRRR